VAAAHRGCSPAHGRAARQRCHSAGAQRHCCRCAQTDPPGSAAPHCAARSGRGTGRQPAPSPPVRTAARDSADSQLRGHPVGPGATAQPSSQQPGAASSFREAAAPQCRRAAPLYDSLWIFALTRRQGQTQSAPSTLPLAESQLDTAGMAAGTNMASPSTLGHQAQRAAAAARLV
jgi:hypothetical protein